MKTKKILLVGLSCLLLFSCDRDENVQIVQDQNAQAKLHKLTMDYVEIQQAKPDTARWPRWLKILVGDVIGAIGGAGLGGGVGAIIGGTVASAAVAANLAVTGNDNGTPEVIFSRNAANPYDATGELHYTTLAACYKDKKNYQNAEGNFDVSAYNLFQMDYYKANTSYTTEELNAGLANAQQPYYLEMVSTLTDDNYKEKFGKMYEDGKISEVTRATMCDYLYAFEMSKDNNDFIAYSKEAERIIIDSHNTDKDKRQILIGMATARFGCKYWEISH